MQKGKRLAVVTYDIETKKTNNSFRVVCLSDFHDCIYGENHVELFHKVEEQNPDFILIAGDVMVARSCTSLKDLSYSIEVIQGLSLIAPVYYSNGNHEERIKNRESTKELFEQYTAQISSERVHVLNNQSLEVSRFGITITGLELPKSYYKRGITPKLEVETLTDLLGSKKDHGFQILIAHNPDYFASYAKWGADLTVAGHVHGGIVRLPYLGGVISPSFHIFPKYDGGLFEIEDKTMVLSRGIGTHTIPIRLWNPPEIVVINVNKES